MKNTKRVETILNINDNSRTISKIPCKVMDSNRKKKKDRKSAHNKGILTYLKNVFSPCCTADDTKPEEQKEQKENLIQPARKQKSKIPLAMKQTVWVNQFGEVYKHKCHTNWCHRVITVFDFEVGHNIPESKGGSTSPENLRPICRQCNIGMGNRYTIDEWSDRKFLN